MIEATSGPSTSKKAVISMEIKKNQWKLYMPHNGKGGHSLEDYWDLLNFYEERSRVQAMSVKHLQEELTII
jgi:hypothetical protein